MLLSELLSSARCATDSFGRKIRFRLYQGVLRDSEITALKYDSRAIRAATTSQSTDDNTHTTGKSSSGAGAVFFALNGARHNGERFITDAVEDGAVAVVCASRSACRLATSLNVTAIQCRQPQLLMSLLAHIFYGMPSNTLTVIGVTGTDGKSTTAYFVYQMLKLLGLRCGLISTVMRDTGEQQQAGAQLNSVHITTPPSTQLHRMLATMHRARYTHAVIETSSHALADETARVAHVRYNAAIVTNITNEHLDFHRTVRRYRAAKARLLRMLHTSPSHSPATPFVLCAATPAVQRYLRRQWMRSGMCVPLARLIGTNRHAPSVHNRHNRFIRYRVETEHSTGVPIPATTPHIHATLTGHKIDGMTMQVAPIAYTGNAKREGGRADVLSDNAQHTSPAVTIALPFCGVYNAENALAALCAAHLLTERSFADIAPLATRIALPPGRLQQVSAPHAHPYRVFVDYAHTAASLLAILELFRPLTEGRLLVLFGSAGMRDREKRGEMGAIAAQHADIIYLTSEDPREESPQAIVDDIMSGVQKQRADATHPDVRVVLDREHAIAAAIGSLQPADTLLLLGKGHEQSMILADSEIAWDEVKVAQRYLAVK